MVSTRENKNEQEEKKNKKKLKKRRTKIKLMAPNKSIKRAYIVQTCSFYYFFIKGINC